MTGPEMDRAIDFLLQQHARFMEEIEQLKEVQKQQSKDIGQLKDTQERQGENIAALADEISEANKQQSENIAGMAAEMRGAFDNLIIANEVTRELSERIGKLALATSQRVTNLEQSQQ